MPQVGPISLENVTHEKAVDTLKATPQRVTLGFIKQPYPNVTPTNLSQDETFMRATTPQGYGGAPPHRPTTPQGYGQHQAVTMRRFFAVTMTSK